MGTSESVGCNERREPLRHVLQHVVGTWFSTIFYEFRRGSVQHERVQMRLTVVRCESLTHDTEQMLHFIYNVPCIILQYAIMYAGLQKVLGVIELAGPTN